MDRSITSVMIVLEVIVPAAIALFLLYFHRLHDRAYLRSWSNFWIALAVFHLASRLAFDAMESIPFGRPDRLILTAAAASALFIAIVHLGAGTFAALRLRPPRSSFLRNLLIAAVAIGVAATLTVAWVYPTGMKLVGFNHVAGFSLGTVYICAGLALWRPAIAERGSWALLAIILVITGAAEIVGALLQTNWDEVIGTPRVVFDIVFSGAIAVGMVIRLLDEERVAALSAASQVAHMVYHEELTGLANRSLLLDRLMIALTQAERRNKLLALIFMDIDGFKPVNDTLGHDVGDELLKEVANRVRSVVRAEDTVARFGGDEFVILINDLRTPEDSGKIGAKLTDSIREPFQIGEHEVSVTTSVGIAIYPEDGTDADTLMRHADQAMYQAKEHGGDQFNLYSVRMNHRALEKLEMENGLRRALEFRQLELHFDPIFDGRTLDLVGFEALLRWDHPIRGLLDAEDFLSAAERSSMIVPIGRFAISDACRQLANWSRKTDTQILVSINVSTVELREDDVAAHVATSMEEYQLDPRRIELEVGESVSDSDLGLQAGLAGTLRGLGVGLTIDGFGSRVASLHQLRAVSASGVKLDARLVTAADEAEAVIGRGITAIARGLNLMVGVEGVSTPEQLSTARSAGFDRVQGPLFTEPIPAEDVVDFIRMSGEKVAHLRR